MDLFRNLFGGKAWHKSLTAWGLVVYAGATALLSAAGETGLLAAETADNAERLVQLLGEIMVVLGLRKAATS